MIFGKQGIAEMSTWSDEQRSNPQAVWQKNANPWHYVTLPSGKQANELASSAEGDALTALARFAPVARDQTKRRDERALALRFIIHIIGDLHQPLDVGNGTNRGGNDITINRTCTAFGMDGRSGLGSSGLIPTFGTPGYVQR